LTRALVSQAARARAQALERARRKTGLPVVRPGSRRGRRRARQERQARAAGVRPGVGVATTSRRRRGCGRAFLTWVSAGGALYVAGSWLASRALSDRLLSGRGLGPVPDHYEDLLNALESNAALAASLRHKGSPRLPVELSATFASPG